MLTYMKKQRLQDNLALTAVENAYLEKNPNLSRNSLGTKKVTLKTAYIDGTHHFLLENGTTLLGTPAGVWATYDAPRDGNKGIVQMLYATRESRHYVPAVLGALGIHSLDVYGELPEGSHNLSCHSVGIQQRLASMLGQLPADAPVNTENWFNSLEYNMYHSELFKSVPYSDISHNIEAGKQFVLDVIAGKLIYSQI